MVLLMTDWSEFYKSQPHRNANYPDQTTLTFRRVMGAIRVSPESCGVGEVLDSFIHSSSVWMKVSQVADSSVVDSSNF